MTGEAVQLDLRTATFITRATAAALDLVVQGVLLVALVLLVSLSSAVADDAVLSGLALCAVVAVFVGYPVTVETLSRGRSVGKVALGLRVVRDDGGPETFRQALVRGLVGFGEIWLASGAVALVASMVSEQGKRVGDHLAGTVVIRERVPARAGPLPQVAPALVAWAATLELAALPGALALDARTFLIRAPDLLPERRQALAASLAAAVATVVHPAPAGPVPDEIYLAAVLAERRNRELARLTRAPLAVPVAAPGAMPPTVTRGPVPSPTLTPPARGIPEGGFALPG